MKELDINSITKKILENDRRTIAKCITLIESEDKANRKNQRDLLNSISPHTGSSIRIGICGSPGVGKSTFLESLGTTILARENKARIAILAIDPSSPIRGGSILGDKIRMETIATDQRVFIRPSPSGATVGGISRTTQEVISVFEAAGYDYIFIETVGVGQSEHIVRNVSDCLVYLQLPNAGDEVQGIKKGILELADIVAVNKSDGLLEKAGKLKQAELNSSLSLSNPHTPPKVLCCSAKEKNGMGEIWDAIIKHHKQLKSSNHLYKKRSEQNRNLFYFEIKEYFLSELKHHPNVNQLLQSSLNDAEQSHASPAQSALHFIEKLCRNYKAD